MTLVGKQTPVVEDSRESVDVSSGKSFVFEEMEITGCGICPASEPSKFGRFWFIAPSTVRARFLSSHGAVHTHRLLPEPLSL